MTASICVRTHMGTLELAGRIERMYGDSSSIQGRPEISYSSVYSPLD